MASYYEQVQEAIRANEKELAHLKEELRGLRSVEKDTPRENFQRQHAQILYYIDQEQNRLASNQALLDNYHAARDGIAELRVSRDNEELDKLRELLASERDPQIRREISEELEAKEREHAERIEALETTVQTSMAGLTDELAEELRQSFLSEDKAKEEAKEEVQAEVEESTTENPASADGETEQVDGKKDDVAEQNTNNAVGPEENQSAEEAQTEERTEEIHDVHQITMQQLFDRANQELEAAELALQESIARFQEIFNEERTRQENEGPFGTEEELDNFRSEYMRRKIEENERFEAARDRVARARRQLERLEEIRDYTASLEEESRSYGVTTEVYEKIKKAVSKKEVLSAIYEQRGLGEVSRRTKAGKEQADRITEEIVANIIEQLKTAGIQTSAATQGNVTQNGVVNVNQNGGININIIDTINIIYGTDIPVKGGPSRTITMTEEEKENVQTTQKSRVKVKVVPHNGNEQEGKTPGKAPEDMPKVKTRGQINAEMERISAKLAEKDEALSAARDALSKAEEDKAEASVIDSRRKAVEKAEREYNEQLDRLRSKQEEYVAVTADGKYDAVGTEKKMKLINGEEYIADEHSIPGDITTLRVAGGKDAGRPAFTDASAKKEGQIDKKSFEKLLNEKYGPVPKDDKPGNDTPADEDGTTGDNPDTPSKEDGTYRLRGDQIIQDEPIRPKKDEDDKKKEEPKVKTQVHVEPQVLYGPPPFEPPKEVKIPEDPNKKNPGGGTGSGNGDGPGKGEEPGTGTKVHVEPQVLYGPPPVEKPQVIEEPEKKTPKRGLMTIMEELTDGLGLKAKDGKRYKASNIKVFKGFKEELSSGNYLYNIVHLVPAIIKLPFNLVRKAVGKIMLRAESKRDIAELKKRLDGLSEEDLMTIYTEYRGNKVLQERYPTILNALLEERMQKFALGKVTEINGELEQRYSAAFAAMHQINAIDEELASEGLTPERRKELQDARAAVISGQAANIATIRSRYIEANNWLSGGLHGFSEDMKAATTKLSLVGKRFAKDHDLNPDLVKRQGALERAEMQAIADGNDEMALRVFVENERLLSENTEIKGSVFGRRSTGEKYYSPLVEQLDYRDDPFVRDLFTTIAVSSAAISTIQSIKAARDQAAIIAENNRRMAANNQTMQQVNQMGQDIAGKRGTMMEGMESQGMQDTLTSANEIERAVLDKTDWGLGTSAYRTADNAGHAYYTTFFDSTKQAYENIAQQYAAGQISQAQAMQMMADLGKQTHQTFSAINTECLNILKPYAQTHPQFDLTGVQGAMEYLQANPSAVEAMNQAMVDVTNAGDVLASMQLQQLIPLTTLPANIRTVIINGAATAALASNINNSMGAKKHTYGNAVTDMVDEYSATQAAQAEQRENSSSK